ncbi:family 20 glycosylhydrolase [Steroidobacter cummioxidans]|uniref:family 20 glycosylhydrolase n=1 Tax=Steroidobacter cummioxidans TaxID=1803913 RepID=UPI000E32486B|nr:family 20 glycosylhydrolase [Steroidobacter cummioxidans]
MQRKRRILTLICCTFVAAVAGCSKPVSDSPATAATTLPVSIIPAPRELTRAAGQFAVTTSTPVVFENGSPAEATARYFIDLMQRTRGMALTARNSDASGAISFKLLADEGTPDDEGYSLDASPRGITVSARSPRGLFYGAVSLWQLLTAEAPSAPGATTIDVPALTITDAPRFRWRGLMLDSARHYQSPQFIKQFIDVMALHKLNVLHWHLTDDQAWRLEIKKYPKLTEVGAWRVPAGPAAAADIDPTTGRPRVYGGFYSQDQVRDIVAYAAARHITIVPEIDMPGHASAAIAAYPKLAVLDNPPRQVPADWGVYPALFNVEESTFGFLQDVLSEVLALFPSEYIHVGGDEAVKDQWKASARVQARMRELGVKDEHALQAHFIERMQAFLSNQGRRLIGWDEILEGGLAPNATVMSWRGIDGAVAAAAAGHDTVLSPQPTLYFDRRPFDTPSSPGRVEISTVQDVYAFDPAPAVISEQQRKHILGVQANIWTEHIRTPARVEFMAFPRAAAIAEVGWSHTKDWAGFSERLPAQLERYRVLDVRFAEAPLPRPVDPLRRSSHEMALCTDKIALSLEDDAPISGERAVFKVDIMEPCWLFKGADLAKANSLVAAVGQVPFNFQIGDAVKQIPLHKPATPAGELEVRLDDCKGERIAVLPLAPAVKNYAVTTLPSASIAPREGIHDLCFMFTRKSVDPIWVIDSIELKTDAVAGTE